MLNPEINHRVRQLPAIARGLRSRSRYTVFERSEFIQYFL
ncbi:hypothetical protein RLEG12_10760 (plasmid) [Rhizobium leguminosarum bv. trifolii CB782]|nr:hypothetical protein RLEG12_10760 [Rhizobium leguminosarum bv. trifolii CB782]